MPAVAVVAVAFYTAPALLTTAGWVIAAGMAIGYEAAGSLIPSLPELGSSPTYRGDSIVNTCSEDITVARLYGKTKIGGNKLRYNDPDASDFRLILGHCSGPVEGVVSYEVNGIAWGDLTGSHTKTEYTGTRTQNPDNRFIAEASAYRSIAYTAFTFEKNDQQIGSDPNITVIMNGLLCAPLAGGADAFTRNPAVIMYDWLLNVEGYTAGDLDTTAFQSLEELCNEVPIGGTLPRYQFDYNFDVNLSINDAKKLIWQSFNGRTIMSQGKIKPVWDSGQMADGAGSLMAKTVSHAFTEDNIVKGSLKRKKPEKFNVVRIHYKDSGKDYKNSSVEIKDEYDILVNGEIPYSEECYFITDPELARRRARFKFNKLRYTDYECTLDAFSGASDLEVYDLVTVTHSKPGWTAKEFLVTKKSENEAGQVRVELSAYYSGAYDDAEVAEQPNYKSDLPNPYATPPANSSVGLALASPGTGFDYDSVEVTITKDPGNPFYSYSEVYVSTNDSDYVYAGKTDISGKLTIQGMGMFYVPGDTVYIRTIVVNENGIKSALPGAAEDSIAITGSIRLGSFYAGLYDFWGGNASINHADTTVVFGNLDGTPKMALGASADSMTLANFGTYPGFYVDGTGSFRGGNATAYLQWNVGSGELTIEGAIIASTSNIAGTAADTFTINSDLDDTTSAIILGRTTGGNLTLSWDGSVGSFDKDIVIDQGSNDGGILSFKNSDINHPFTAYADQSSFGIFSKVDPLRGGLCIQGYTDTDAPHGAVNIVGLTGASNPTDSYPVIVLDTYKYSGSGGVGSALSDTERMLEIRNLGGTRWHINGNGDTVQTGDLYVNGGNISTSSGDLTLTSATTGVNIESSLNIARNATGTGFTFNGAGGEHLTFRQNSEDYWRIYAYDTAEAVYKKLYIGGSTGFLFDIENETFMLPSTSTIITYAGGLTISPVGDLTLSPGDELIIDPSGNAMIINASVDISTNNFVSQSTGWNINYDGSADFRNLYADELFVKAFTAEVYSALAGGLIITKSRAELTRDFTIPNTSGTATLYVSDLEGLSDTAVFVAGDYIRLRVIDRSGGGLVVTDVYGTVASYTNLSGGEQSWTFTTTTAGYSSSDVIYAGSVALDYGQTGSGSTGVWEVTVLDPSGSPYSQVQTWSGVSGGEPTTFTTWTRIGNLDGLSGIGEEYGIYAGQGLTDSDPYVLITDQQVDLHNIPITIHDGVAERIKLDPSGPTFALGASTPSAFLTGDGIWMGNDSGTYKFRVGDVNGEVFYWDGSTFYLGVVASEHIRADGTTVAFYNNTTKMAELSGTNWTIGNTSDSYITLTNTALTMFATDGTDQLLIQADYLRIGDFTTFNFLNINSTNGIRMYAGTASATLYAQLTNAGVLYLGNQSAEHVKVSSSGTQIYDGATLYATYGATTTIGLTASEHISISSTSVQFLDGASVYTDLTAGVLTLGLSSAEHAVIDSNGITLYDGATQLANYGATTTIGQVATGKGNFYIDASGNISGRVNTTERWKINTDNSGWLGTSGNGISWSTSGEIVIGGFTHISGYLYSLTSGTPTSSPVGGIVIKGGTSGGYKVYDASGVLRVDLGYIA